jgi:hypothetical protein
MVAVAIVIEMASCVTTLRLMFLMHCLHYLQCIRCLRSAQLTADF